jgi:Na+/H+ antiporter NhaD/arsenite permease-like protein
MLAPSHAPVGPSILTALPFAALLLAIALLPLFHGTRHWWERNINKFFIALTFAVSVLGYYALRGEGFHGSAPGIDAVVSVLHHALVHEYVPFMVLLFSLYVIAGGITVRGDIQATPTVNTAYLGTGTLLASLIGTTGASMLLIRPLLKTNRERKRVVHTVVFFIFLVSNIGGSLLPIGDPPLFLGYLLGVPFFWTFNSFVPWLVLTCALLAIYWVWDRREHARETPAAMREDVIRYEPITMAGWINFGLLAGVVAAVALLDPHRPVPGTSWHPPEHLREGLQLALAGLSLLLTPSGLRQENRFTYVPIIEVACLFLGIFITMQPPIELLRVTGPALASHGLSSPAVFFWATGLLSSLLDNAPTYVVFFETAVALNPTREGLLLPNGTAINPHLLLAISCGAVFMGAMSYIGNGPNFMVKSIAEEAGIRMPSFFGYMAYSGAVLLPLFVVLTMLFF